MKEAPDGRCRTRRRFTKPPKSAEWLLLSMLPDDVGEAVNGDLAEIFETVILPSSGRFGARLWYWRQVFCSLRLILRFRRSPQSALESWKGQIKLENPRNHTVTYHQGIRIDKIPIQGAMGLLFVFATLFIFGVGIPAVRGLAVIAAVFGIPGAGLLYYWHQRHAPKIRCLNLHGPAVAGALRRLGRYQKKRDKKQDHHDVK